MNVVTSRTINQNRVVEIDRALQARQINRARDMVESLTHDAPDFVEGWILAARVCQMTGNYTAMREHLAQALRLEPHSPLAQLLDVEALVHLGQIKQVIENLSTMEVEARLDPVWLSRISETYTQIGRFEDAVRCSHLAVGLDPNQPALRYNLASALTATGELQEAEKQYDALISIAPTDYDAYYNRAVLRKQTQQKNHIPELRARLSDPQTNTAGGVQLNYALAKELEDIGDFDASFEVLRTGATIRRSMMGYDVATDVQAMEKIEQCFDARFFAQTKPAKPQDGPIFILGFPRSGTTLVDRILSSHPEVESLGELNDFALSLTQCCKSSRGKAGLIEASTALDMETLGANYLERVRQRSIGKRFFIDKTPANFLYIGLLAKSIPGARIIHLNRGTMDNAFGMYKALFRMGYPYSYDFDDLAKYVKAKSRLMAHWRRVLPNTIIDVHYENVVENLEGETRRLLEKIGLPWNSSCLDFHKNTSPSATASAGQVRQPIYTNAVERWKRYETQLMPLRQALGDMV